MFWRPKIFFFCLLLLLPACDVEKYPLPEGSDRPDILIYCGITMIQPILEIGTLLEQQENCRVKITYGGSGHLLRSVEVNQLGDIFFPGSASYVKKLALTGVVTKMQQVGYNEAGLFVRSGNPLRIKADVTSLLDRQLRVVIGNAQAGSIGRETKRILEHKGIFQQVVETSLYMTTDSKGLARAIRDGDADLVMNWKATGYLEDNLGKMDFLSVAESAEDKKPLVMGLLKFSRDPVLAEKMIQLAASTVGQDIFRKYGFLD